MRNRVSCQGRRRKEPVGANEHNYSPMCDGLLEREGDFCWLSNAGGEYTHILIFIPGNEGGSVAPIPVVAGPHVEGKIAWGWNGDLDRPTLTPSIYRNRPSDGRPEPQNEWHGHLTLGFLHSD